MDRKNAASRNPAAGCAIESLEKRMLFHLTFGPTATLVGQDLETQQFPYINGSGETVAVLDTGIDYQNPLLGGGIGPHHKVLGGYDFVTNGPLTGDPDGHGSGVSGIIAANEFRYGSHIYSGLAPDVNLVVVRIDDSVDNPTGAIINEGLNWVLAHRARYNIVAVNISEGDGNKYPVKTTGVNTPLLQELNQQGVFVAAASGNDGWSGGVEYPGADPYVASVGSVDSFGVIADFTDTGTSLNLLAPGVDVPTTYTNSANGQPLIVPASYTSFSSPFAAGAAALVRQADPALNPTQILSILQATGSPAEDPANGQTYAIINVDKAVADAVHLASRARRSASIANADAATPSTALTASLVPTTPGTSGFNQNTQIKHGLFDDAPALE